MNFIVSPGFFDRVMRMAAILFLSLFFMVSGVISSAVAARPVNSEISKIMRERAAVEQNLQSLKQQLREYQSKLNLTTRKESQSFKVLENIRTQILVLEKIISQNQIYLAKLDRDIEQLRDKLQGNRQIYGKVSDDFRRTAVSVYKYGGNRDVEHVFGAGSVNNALVRAQYVGFFTRAVRRNVNDLQQVAVKLENNRLALEQSYQQKAAMVREQERQLKTWSVSKKEKEEVLDRLKKNKQEYAAQLAVVKQKRRQLQSRIESLILAEQRVVEAENERQKKILEARRLEAKRRESKRLEAQHALAKKEKSTGQAADTARKERKKIEKAQVKSSEKKSVMVMPKADSPEIEKVSADFDNASGSLPWPVQNGVVSQKFGSLEDKDLRIVTTNNGIDISVPASTPVRAVSGGKVVQIAFLPTFGNIVIVRHPKSYLTVYANLGQLNVVKDDLIKSQQLLGVSGKMGDGGSVVHFEIWKGRVKQNPEKWLRR
ncbi:MAG: peptidoglycan DD-metalloendopeptidase family protein [Chlorobiaceae bacterium]|jgi:murein hydrolase activator